jgi:hypothetical protein
MRARRLPLAFSLALLTIGSIGITVTRTPIEVFLCAELVTISTFYIFFTVLIPSIRTEIVNPEKIFLGGVAKPPYIAASELLSPGIPLISEELDDAWELYFDRTKVKPKAKEVIG